MIKSLVLLLAFTLATSFPIGMSASGAAAASSTVQTKKWCVDNFKTKKVTCAATLEAAETLNGVSSANTRGTGAAPDSTLQDYIAYVLWNDYNYTGSGYFLWNYPCYGGPNGWNNLIDWQDQTRSAQPINCAAITIYGWFNLYTHPNGPTYCYTTGGNVYPLGGGSAGYGKSFKMGAGPSGAPWCG